MSINNEKEVEKLFICLLKNTEFEGKVYSVGGFVRDDILKIPSKDLDIVVEIKNGAEKFAKFVHNLFPFYTSTPYEMGKGYPIWHIVFKSNVVFKGIVFFTENAEIDIADTQKESFPDPLSRQRITIFGTLDEDLRRRDFTCNMLLRDLTSGEILDKVGGISDITQGLLRFHPAVDPLKPFSDDPLRMLRLIRFHTRFGWAVDPQVKEAAKKCADRIKIISAERINTELTKIMGYGKLAEAIELMSDLDLLKYVLPEIEELKNVTQSPEHHFEGDTYIHTLSVLRKAENGIIPQLVALLHDVGKKKAKTIDESGKMSFLKHEDYSAEIAEEILTRLKFDRDLIDIVKHIVKNHMRAHFCKEWSTGAIRRFVREAGSNLDYILNLTQIDNLSSLTLSGEPKKDYIEDLRERIKTVTLIPISKKPILDGLEIMDTLKIPPSKRVGEIGKLLLDLEDEYASSNKILTKEDAFIFLKNIP